MTHSGKNGRKASREYTEKISLKQDLKQDRLEIGQVKEFKYVFYGNEKLN